MNYYPGIQGPTKDRVKRYYKMIADTLEIKYAYIRSKHQRLIAFLKKEIFARVA